MLDRQGEVLEGAGRPCICFRRIVSALVTQLPQQGRSSTEGRQNDAVERDAHHQYPCEQRIRHAESLFEAKLITLRTILDLQAEKSVAALAASDKAIQKAEVAVEKRFESVNEFRQTLSDQTKSFISRVEFEALRDTNSARITDLSSRLDKIEGKAVGLHAGWIYLLGGVAALGTIVSLILAFIRSKP